LVFNITINISQRRVVKFSFALVMSTIILLSGCANTGDVSESSYWGKTKGVVVKTGGAIAKAPQQTYRVMTAAAAATSSEINDAWISSTLKSHYILDYYINANLIDIEIDHGDITLFGQVSAGIIQERAVLLAKSLQGVKSVTSRLVIIPVY